LNVLFADGTVFTRNTTGGSLMMVPMPAPAALEWSEKHNGAALAHPSFVLPRTDFLRGYSE
jgi:hypothetical protein